MLQDDAKYECFQTNLDSKSRKFLRFSFPRLYPTKKLMIPVSTVWHTNQPAIITNGADDKEIKLMVTAIQNNAPRFKKRKKPSFPINLVDKIDIRAKIRSR